MYLNNQFKIPGLFRLIVNGYSLSSRYLGFLTYDLEKFEQKSFKNSLLLVECIGMHDKNEHAFKIYEVLPLHPLHF